MPRKITPYSLKPWRAVTAALVIAAPLLAYQHLSASPAFAQTSAAATASSGGLEKEEQLRKKEQQKYVREHSDPSGKVPSGAYIQGMEHVRQMKVAPHIGAKPLGETPAVSTNPANK
jgi:hypothetical protein